MCQSVPAVNIPPWPTPGGIFGWDEIPTPGKKSCKTQPPGKNSREKKL